MLTGLDISVACEWVTGSSYNKNAMSSINHIEVMPHVAKYLRNNDSAAEGQCNSFFHVIYQQYVKHYRQLDEGDTVAVIWWNSIGNDSLYINWWDMGFYKCIPYSDKMIDELTVITVKSFTNVHPSWLEWEYLYKFLDFFLLW